MASSRVNKSTTYKSVSGKSASLRPVSVKPAKTRADTYYKCAKCTDGYEFDRLKAGVRTMWAKSLEAHVARVHPEDKENWEDCIGEKLRKTRVSKGTENARVSVEKLTKAKVSVTTAAAAATATAAIALLEAQTEEEDDDSESEDGDKEDMEYEEAPEDPMDKDYVN